MKCVLALKINGIYSRQNGCSKAKKNIELAKLIHVFIVYFLSGERTDVHNGQVFILVDGEKGN